MGKKEVNKRMGQIYAVAKQNGINEEEFMKYLNQAFAFLYQGDKYEGYKAK